MKKLRVRAGCLISLTMLPTMILVMLIVGERLSVGEMLADWWRMFKEGRT